MVHLSDARCFGAMTHGFSTRPGWFVDPEGRPTLLRGLWSGNAHARTLKEELCGKKSKKNRCFFKA